ncbi:MAG: DUF2163 domain-containing protein [Pseudomonadota bacterium]
MDEAGYISHVVNGLTSFCRAWVVTRKDGVTFGFTDHDLDLTFDGIVFRADTGLTAVALQQSTGLSVDNSEALGALSDISLSEEDLNSGLYDGAEVLAWSVNWQDVEQRKVLFRGNIGQIERQAGHYRAELRGLADRLNTPTGKFFSPTCSAILGDAKCGVDTSDPSFGMTAKIEVIEPGYSFRITPQSNYPERWFERGRVQFLSGSAQHMIGVVKWDRIVGEARELALWERLKANFKDGDDVFVHAGCDKAFSTCAAKFQNVPNFRGFPDIPGSDWLLTHPSLSNETNGGSRR